VTAAIGRSVYGDCETPSWRGDVGMDVACLFKHGSPADLDMTRWCRACLLAKVRALQAGLEQIELQARSART
jgi:hypothetical protein